MLSRHNIKMLTLHQDDFGPQYYEGWPWTQDHMSVLHLTVQVLFETRLKKCYPTAWQWQSTDLTMTTFNSRTPDVWGESSGKLLSWSFIPATSRLHPPRTQAASPRCVSCLQSSRAKLSCSFPPHTRSFPPNSNGIVSQTSVLHCWCQWSLGHLIHV